MAEDEPDSTAEVGEIDREWERTSLSHPEDAKARNVALMTYLEDHGAREKP